MSKVAPTPGDAHRTHSLDLGASAPIVLSDVPPLGGGATAGSSAGAISAAGLLPTGWVPWRGRPELWGGGCALAEPYCVVPGPGRGIQTVHAGSAATIGQASRGVGQACGCPSQTTRPGNGHGRKQPGCEEPAQPPKPAQRCPFPGPPWPQGCVTLPPSSLQGFSPAAAAVLGLLCGVTSSKARTTHQALLSLVKQPVPALFPRPPHGAWPCAPWLHHPARPCSLQLYVQVRCCSSEPCVGSRLCSPPQPHTLFSTCSPLRCARTRLCSP